MNRVADVIPHEHLAHADDIVRILFHTVSHESAQDPHKDIQIEVRHKRSILVPDMDRIRLFTLEDPPLYKSIPDLPKHQDQIPPVGRMIQMEQNIFSNLKEVQNGTEALQPIAVRVSAFQRLKAIRDIS